MHRLLDAGPYPDRAPRAPGSNSTAIGFFSAVLTSLKRPGQEYRNVSAAALVKGADEIDLHDHSDVIGVGRAQYLNLAVRFGVRRCRFDIV